MTCHLHHTAKEVSLAISVFNSSDTFVSSGLFTVGWFREFLYFTKTQNIRIIKNIYDSIAVMT